MNYLIFVILLIPTNVLSLPYIPNDSVYDDEGCLTRFVVSSSYFTQSKSITFASYESICYPSRKNPSYSLPDYFKNSYQLDPDGCTYHVSKKDEVILINGTKSRSSIYSITCPKNNEKICSKAHCQNF